MRTRFVSALLALALPICAQDPSAEAENNFYKAFYLEKGARDFSGAMELYAKFLAAAPDHKLAKTAAQQQFGLLNKTGRTKERDAFREKYAALLGGADAPRERPARGEDEGDADAPRGRDEGDAPRGRGQGGFGGRGQGFDPAARTAELEKELAKAKEDGDEEQAARLTRQLERMKQFAERGARGQGGPGQAGRGGFGRSTKPLAEMNEEELGQFKSRLERMSGMIDRMKENLGEEQAKALQTNMDSLQKALDGGKLEDAQKAYDKIRESMP
ncbi:MAG: hypothetical protein KDC98_11455, partial [Planctomycetes bacterium]|nr:hypothetical protein [Planctomycetota bacterium]